MISQNVNTMIENINICTNCSGMVIYDQDADSLDGTEASYCWILTQQCTKIRKMKRLRPLCWHRAWPKSASACQILTQSSQCDACRIRISLLKFKWSVRIRKWTKCEQRYICMPNLMKILQCILKMMPRNLPWMDRQTDGWSDNPTCTLMFYWHNLISMKQGNSISYSSYPGK